MATLKLDTYNPDHLGYFRGTEIYSNQAFARPATGLELEARVRTNMTTRGGVTAFFTYTQVPPNNYAHEIDFEFLTNQIPSGKVLVSSWKDWGAPGSAYNDGIHHRSNDIGGAGQSVPGLDLTEFNTFKIRWLPNSTEWYVNGALLSSWPDAHPTAPMPVRFNFWAPDAGWTAAFDSGLQPVLSAGLNQSFAYDVDYVQVSVVPVPEPTSAPADLWRRGLLVRWLRVSRRGGPNRARVPGPRSDSIMKRIWFHSHAISHGEHTPPERWPWHRAGSVSTNRVRWTILCATVTAWRTVCRMEGAEEVAGIISGSSKMMAWAPAGGSAAELGACGAGGVTGA